MIIFELSCTHGHRFEGWFGSSEDFEQQQGRGLVRCPVCDDGGVVKVPTAKVHTGQKRPTEPVPAAAAPAGAGTAPAVPALAGLPPEILTQLRAIVKSAEDVGGRFAEEARKIHYKEVEPRSIRGQATREEAESMLDEGIEFAPLPQFLVDEGH